jgi:hypothetical protein
MCLVNCEEPLEPWWVWADMFPKGMPDTYMFGEPRLNPGLLLGRRARETVSKQLEILRAARIAKSSDSDRGIKF